MNELSETLKATASTATASISAVLFDYGQVLSKGPNAAAWESMRRIIPAAPDAFHNAYWTPRHEYDRGMLSGTAYWQEVARAAGCAKLSEEQLGALYAADVALWTDLNEPMVAWAQELHRRGIRIGILSNIGDRMETGIRQSFAWIDDFHHCTWSHQLKMAKPEIEIYHHAADGLETEPSRILFIDDREENISAARAAGMRAIHYLGHEGFVATMEQMGLGELL